MSEETLKSALFLATILGVGFLGTVAVLVTSHAMISRFYLLVQIFTVGVGGSHLVGIVWNTIFDLSQIPVGAPFNVGGLLMYGWFVTGATLGFVFTITHVVYTLIAWMLAHGEVVMFDVYTRWQIESQRRDAAAAEQSVKLLS